MAKPPYLIFSESNCRNDTPEVKILELTDAIFWDKYWAELSLPAIADTSSAYERCILQQLETHAVKTGGKAMEVGCAPGAWLAYLSLKCEMRASGIEYSSAGMTATKRNFAMLGVAPDLLIEGDFFVAEPSPDFDLVMSFGFIEHFSNPAEVIERHLRWVKPGGTLVLGVPRFRGIYALIQRWLDKEVLDKHNQEIMELAYFHNLADQFSLAPAFIGYTGSFEPSMFILGPRKNIASLVLRTLLWAARQLRKLRLFDQFNNDVVSGYILAIYRKRGEA